MMNTSSLNCLISAGRLMSEILYPTKFVIEPILSAERGVFCVTGILLPAAACVVPHPASSTPAAMIRNAAPAITVFFTTLILLSCLSVFLCLSRQILHPFIPAEMEDHPRNLPHLIQTCTCIYQQRRPVKVKCTRKCKWNGNTPHLNFQSF